MSLHESNASDTSRQRLSVTAEAQTSDDSPRERARLAWRDPETGCWLEVDLVGSDAFLDELVAMGFEIVSRQAAAAPTVEPLRRDGGRAGGNQSVRSSGPEASAFGVAGSAPLFPPHQRSA